VTWLSRPALLWAFDEAPDVPARLVSTLLAVARYASTDGRGAYPSAATVAAMTRKSESQAKRDMAALAKLGLLEPGDHRIVQDIRADRRPKVYDLPMPRGASERTPSDGPRGASGDTTGCISLQNGVRPDAPEEFLKNSGTGAGATGAGAPARSRPQTPLTAPPCHVCGQPFSQEELADPAFRRAAIEGEVMHDTPECTYISEHCRQCGAELADHEIEQCDTCATVAAS
jgi:hypothetical protein